jgi:hypothetical protein
MAYFNPDEIPLVTGASSTTFLVILGKGNVTFRGLDKDLFVILDNKIDNINISVHMWGPA